MTKSYRILDTPEPSTDPVRAGRLRPALWLVLIVGLACNAAASTIGATAVGIGFGVITLAAATGLIVDHYRRRNR